MSQAEPLAKRARSGVYANGTGEGYFRRLSCAKCYCEGQQGSISCVLEACTSTGLIRVPHQGAASRRGVFHANARLTAAWPEPLAEVARQASPTISAADGDWRETCLGMVRAVLAQMDPNSRYIFDRCVTCWCWARARSEAGLGKRGLMVVWCRHRQESWQAVAQVHVHACEACYPAGSSTKADVVCVPRFSYGLPHNRTWPGDCLGSSSAHDRWKLRPHLGLLCHMQAGELECGARLPEGHQAPHGPRHHHTASAGRLL